MRFLAIADDLTATRNITLKSGLLVSCGDIDDFFILKAAAAADSEAIFAVKGNHDSPSCFSPPIVDLHMNRWTYKGISFGGFGGSWRYKPIGCFLYSQKDVWDALIDFPRVDVFVAHNSPRGIHDRADDVHYGFDAFLEYIEACQPRLFLHGHQHVSAETRIGVTRVVGIYGLQEISLDF